MARTSRLSLTAALVAGAVIGWLGSSGPIPISHAVLAAGTADLQPARAVRTPGGRRVTLMPAPNRAAAAEIAAAQASSGGKPNILVIFGDDVGQTNISAYSFGVVGYQTPNIDRIAKEGMQFTDYYAENSCTAGRSTFITGEVGFRTGLLKVGIPGAKEGLQKQNITIAEALKPLGYATGQFGKNHLGDRDDFLPTAHGFDEFFGNLYHLNAEEEPERPYYPTQDKEFMKQAPRGVLHSFADGKIEDTGPLTRKRMETIDDETTQACIDFITKQKNAGKPFFAWMNFTRMHVFTHVRESMRGQSGMPGNEYADGMVEMDNNVGKLLKVVDDLGIADNTMVVFSTDNGPNQFSWPDAATTPFRSEKDTNWEGAFRVPAVIRWPGHVKPGSVSNDMVSGLDWFPTILAAAGDTTIKDRLLKGWAAKTGGMTYKVHLDGFNLLPFLERQGEVSAPRVLLLQRRWVAGGGTFRQLEDRLLRAAGARRLRGVGESVHMSAGTESLQPAHGSVRAGGRRVGSVLRLDSQKRIYGPMVVVQSRSIHSDLEGLSAEPAGRQLLDRPDAGTAVEVDRGREVIRS